MIKLFDVTADAERHDVEGASDRRSRYGAYLRDRAAAFADFDDTPTTDQREFACQAFRIAQAPIMSPPYVSTHPRIVSDPPARWIRDDDDRWAWVIDLAVPFPDAVDKELRYKPVRTWQQHGGWWDRPYELSMMHAFTTLTLHVPIGAGEAARLPTPRYNAGIGHAPDTDTAKKACRRMCELLNERVGSILAAIEND